MPTIDINERYGTAILQDHQLVYADENYARLFGYTSAMELMADIDTFLDLIEPDYHSEAIANYQQQVNMQAKPCGRTFKNVDRFGSVFTVFTLDHIIEWEGKPAMQVTVVDLSKLDSAYSTLRKHAQQYKQLILNSLQGMIVHRNFRPVLVNQAWVDLLRAPSREFVIEQVHLLDGLDPTVREKAQARHDALLAGEIESAQNHVEYKCFDGVWRHFNLYDNRVEWDGEPAIHVVIEDVTEKVELESKLRYRANHDSLTGLYNREAIYQWFEKMVNRVVSIACLLIDIDWFKSVNDDYGHQAGDSFLQVIAKACQDSVPNQGILGRWGGEEFVVLLPDVCKDRAISIADNLRLGCQDALFIQHGHTIQRTVSIGVATCHRDTNLDNLIGLADNALYRAKADGRNRIAGPIELK